ncbi:MAG: UbiA family prenyltransferase [bacterium]|nr:UbiA family prenyltransferase [bacterium]
MSLGLIIALTISVALMWGIKILIDFLSIKYGGLKSIPSDNGADYLGLLILAATVTLVISASLGAVYFWWLSILVVGHLLFWTLQRLWMKSDERLLGLVQKQGTELRSLLPVTLALELSPKIDEMTIDTLKTLLSQRTYLHTCEKEVKRNINEMRRHSSLYPKDAEKNLGEIGNDLSEKLKKVEMQIAAYPSVLGKMIADLYDAKVSGSTPEELQKHFDDFLSRLQEEAERMKVAETEVLNISR